MVENIPVVYVITYTIKRGEIYNFFGLTKTKIVQNDKQPLFRLGRIEYSTLQRKKNIHPEKKVSHSVRHPLAELGFKLV